MKLVDNKTYSFLRNFDLLIKLKLSVVVNVCLFGFFLLFFLCMVNFVACSLIAVILHQLLAWDIWYQFYCCFSHPLQLQLCQAASDLKFLHFQR